MNGQNWVDLINRIPAAMDAAEKLLPESGNGANKLALVTNAIVPLLPLAEVSPKIAAIQEWMSALVGIYNVFGKYNTTQAGPAVNVN